MNSAKLVFAMMAVALSLSLLAAEEPKQETPQQCTATIKLVKSEKGKPPVTLATPTMVFPIGQVAKFQCGDDNQRVEVSITTSKEPQLHRVQAKIIDAPSSEKPRVITCPTLVTMDGKTGTINVGSITMEVMVERMK